MVPMYIEAPSGTMGAVPLSGVLHLYMARQFDSLYSSIPLFLSAPVQISGDMLSMYIDGETTSNSGIDLYVKGIHNPFDTINLYSHGY